MPAKCLATTRTKKVQQRHISSTITWALRAFSTVGGCQGIPCNCRAVGCCALWIWEDIDRRYWNLILDTICTQTHILYSKHWNNASSRIQKEFKSTITLNVECQEGLAVPSTPPLHRLAFRLDISSEVLTTHADACDDSSNDQSIFAPGEHAWKAQVAQQPPKGGAKKRPAKGCKSTGVVVTNRDNLMITHIWAAD